MVEGKTKSGFEYKIEEERFDDYETFEKICAIDSDNRNVALVIEVFNELLGQQQYKELKEHIRNENGRVSTNLMMEALFDILNSDAVEIKN